MNNDENRIEGIGLIKNQTANEVYRSTPNLKFKLFSERNYNRYIYIGNEIYATREELERNHTPDAVTINEYLDTHTRTPLELIEKFLFKGATHMKRGSGITRIKTELLDKKISR